MKLITKATFTNAVNEREKRNLDIAYRAACEGAVLLENDGALPLKSRRIALYGAGASMTVKGGTGSGEVNERHSVSILEGLENRGFTVTTKGWIEAFERQCAEAEAAFTARQKKALLKLKLKSVMDMMFASFQPPAGPRITARDVAESDADTCVYVISRQAGEGADRKAEPGDYLFSDAEKADIALCAASYETFVLLVNSGSSVDLSVLDETPGVGAVLYVCQLGTEGGNAVADLLSGRVTPSGKLTDTWAKRYADVPFSDEFSYRNGDLNNENYKEGVYVGYRYFDSFGVAPRYPFGYGKSYTDFTITPLSARVDGGRVTLRAEVQNTGKSYAGREVVQAYVSAPSGTLEREYQSLAAFEKTGELNPGEAETVTLSFELAALAGYRESDARFVLEQGDYIVRLGGSSRDTAPCAVLTIDGEAVVSVHAHICPQQAPVQELKAPARESEPIPASVPRLSVSAGAFVSRTHEYHVPKPPVDSRTEAFLQGLSAKDMAELVVGIGMFGGKTHFTLPGAVGNTTSKFWGRGLVNVALCDGPAGLRVQKRSTVTKSGAVKPLEMPISIFNMFPDFVKKFMLGNEKKDPVVYQYTTAFPVAAALAQSWNTALLSAVGEAIHDEMAEYGCTFWLAPALNIHRNPLCGRNFEYFSEDPFLSGVMAAAITRGVQKEPGYYVTLKHFACNNQEDNRNFVSSNLSERALREIYLRGFEIAVKQGGARAVMTSYNRINGVYTPNSYDLCSKVLRNEWGFTGVVMTDWFSTNRGQADNALAMRAGNDLIMPGGGYFKRAILRGIRQGVITEEDLRRCCANVVYAIFNSATQREYLG